MPSEIPTQFNLASEWHLGASPAAVFALLQKPQDWPAWWRYVHAVEALAGEGNFRFIWNTRLPYRLTMDIRTTIEEFPRLMVGDASGDVRGSGRWELDEVPGGARVRYIWQVHLDKIWMRLAAPAMAPLFSWNHHAVMRAGAKGMAQQLGVSLFDYRRLDRR